MRIVITGGAGFLGRRLADALTARGTMAGSDGAPVRIREIVLVDTHACETPAAGPVLLTSVAADICDRDTMANLITPETDSVFHLAAVVSAQAESDFDLGMKVNFDGTRNLLEICRNLARPIKFVTTSSVASFGGDLPPVVPDGFAQMPENSYGTQKAMSELLVNDYSRRGFVDGRIIRLPTIVVRPGKPNAAASSFASSIFREPLQGQRAICPVNADMPVWLMSPRRAVESLVQAHELVLDQSVANRSFSLPGISLTVGEMVEALKRVGGAEVVARVDWKYDQKTSEIVSGWPGAFEATRALAMGFKADDSMDAIIQAFIEDDMVPAAVT